jgi:hypothetical protein
MRFVFIIMAGLFVAAFGLRMLHDRNQTVDCCDDTQTCSVQIWKASAKGS